MLSKIWYLAYLQKPPVDIIQNIRKDIHDFHSNYRKVRVNTITLTQEMRRLVMKDIETQCEAIQCSIFAKSIVLYLFAICHKNVITYTQVLINVILNKSRIDKDNIVCNEKYITTYTNLVYH